MNKNRPLSQQVDYARISAPVYFRLGIFLKQAAVKYPKPIYEHRLTDDENWNAAMNHMLAYRAKLTDEDHLLSAVVRLLMIAEREAREAEGHDAE